MKQIVDHPSWWPVIAQFCAERIGDSPKQDNFAAIGLLDGDKLIAGVVYSDYNGSNITAGIAVDGKINREFLRIMFHYPFIQAGAKRITACVEQTNIVSQQFVKHLGFELEFTMKEAGKTGDLLIYRMFRKDCRFLERRYGKQITNS